MHDENNSVSTGSLGNRFRSCPNCHELVETDTRFCRFCGFDTSDPLANTPDPNISGYTAPTTIVPTVCYLPDGRRIPFEYNQSFRPEAFSWAAFWFADLWFADKGFTQNAWRHFRYRIAVTMLGIIMVIIGVYAGIAGETNIPESTRVVLSVLSITWLLFLTVTIVVSYNDAKDALRRYLDFTCSISSEQFEKCCAEGRKAYWIMLFTPFAIYLFAFLIMLIIVGNDGSGQLNPEELARFLLINISPK